MSGRSAYVRKKITETKLANKDSSTRAKTATSSEDSATVCDYPTPANRRDTGVPTTNARFLKFSEPVRDRATDAVLHYQSSGSQSGSSVDGRRDVGGAAQFHGPLEDFAYARARRPVIKTEDVSGIEKSGLRNMLDKKSDDVRKGLAKTFGFSKKKEKYDNARPESSATVRPGQAGRGTTDMGSGYRDRIDTDLELVSGQLQTGPYQGAAHPWDGSGTLVGPPTKSSLSAVTPLIKRWSGAGRSVQRWNKLRKDPELWDPDGDVLVFLEHEQEPRPSPSFRLSSHIIEATGSQHLINQLRVASNEEDMEYVPSWHHRGQGRYTERHHMSHLPSGSYKRSGQPTPPIPGDVPPWGDDGQVSYEMYFPAPANMSVVEQTRYHIATRNVFALLYHASLVGLSLHQALCDLQARMESYMPADADNVGMIINLLSARAIDDVRNDAETALSLLAWSEGNTVRWEEGWRESFLHCAGLYLRLESCADFKNITPITRALLERASLETQLRVHAAEERLAEFEYGDMWPASISTAANASGPVTSSPAKGAADRLQGFLIQHYSQRFGRWPPLSLQGQEGRSTGTGYSGDVGDELWLTRTVAQTLQSDFSALYDFLVDRDIIWDSSEARSSRKWLMVSESGNRAFEADSPELPMMDMLIEFDNKSRFPHIPHPYCLVPESVTPVMTSKGSSSAGGIFSGAIRAGKKSGNTNTTNSSNGTGGFGATERRIQLAYTEASNICVLGSDYSHSNLIDAFTRFEKADRTGEVDPCIARRGRWVLLYGILQTLASVSVDAPIVRYRDEVPYHLSPRLKGAKIPPWKTAGSAQRHDPSYGSSESCLGARHDLSHCWTVSRTWNEVETSGSSADEGASSNGTTAMATSYSYNYPFPKPPPPTLSTTGRSSAAEYYTSLGTRAVSVASSVASSSASNNYTPFSVAGSVVSESDTASSVRTGSSYKGDRRRQEGGARGAPRGIGRVDEHCQDWPGQQQSYLIGQDYENDTTISSTSGNVSNGRHHQEHQLSPLRVPGNPTKPGDYLLIDHPVKGTRNAAWAVGLSERGRRRICQGDDSSGKSRSESVAGTSMRPGMRKNGSAIGNVAPVIKDFDDLSIMDDNQV